MRRIIHTIVSGALVAALVPGAVSAAPLHPNAFDLPGAEQPGATLEYDSANRLRRVKRGSLDIRYLYDALGNLEAEIVDDGVTVKRTDLMVDESGPLPRIVGALTDDGAKELYAYGPMGVAMVRKTAAGQAQGTTYHALTDELGTVRGLADGTGALAGRIAYGPFGRVRVTEGEQTRLAFTGEYRDTAGLIWLRARHYAPFLGRFLQRDTVVDDPGNPQTLNRYAYAANNPLSNTDPSGHYVESALDGASLAVGLYSISQWRDDTPLWMRALDVAGVAVDLAALALPLVPGGASLMGRTGKAVDITSAAAGTPDALRRDPTGMRAVGELKTGEGAAFVLELNSGRAAMVAGNDVVTQGPRARRRNIVHFDLVSAFPGLGENYVGGFITRRADGAWDANFLSRQLHIPGKTVGVGRLRHPRVPVITGEVGLLNPALKGITAKHLANATGKRVYHSGELLADPTRLRWFGGLGAAYHYPTLQQAWSRAPVCDSSVELFCPGDEPNVYQRREREPIDDPF